MEVHAGMMPVSGVLPLESCVNVRLLKRHLNFAQKRGLLKEGVLSCLVAAVELQGLRN